MFSTTSYSPACCASSSILSALLLLLATLSSSWLMFLSLSVIVFTVEFEAAAAVFAEFIRTPVSPEIKRTG